jgi:hypothetical protein
MPEKDERHDEDAIEDLPIVEARAFATVSTPALEPVVQRPNDRGGLSAWVVLVGLLAAGLAGAVWALVR